MITFESEFELYCSDCGEKLTGKFEYYKSKKPQLVIDLCAVCRTKFFINGKKEGEKNERTRRHDEITQKKLGSVHPLNIVPNNPGDDSKKSTG